MTFSALDSALTGPLFATAAMRTVFADRSRLAAMLRVEAALARAEAKHGMADGKLATAIDRIKPDDLDLAALGHETATAGVPTIPFVKAVQARLPAGLRSDFHRGATSQDIADTALVLQCADAFRLIVDDLRAIIPALSKMATRHRATPCAGRTYGQHAAPVSFGYVVAVWLAGIAEAADALPRIREHILSASLGGPVGTGSGAGDKADAITRAFARELGLAATPAPWHVLRGRMVETGTWLAMLIGSLAKMGEDIARLSSTEVGEVAEPHHAGRGGSSAMPHKRNPVSATIILAAHGAAKGHVVTLLDAMAAEFQRSAGLWHAEWHALPQLFGLASGALREALTLATSLVIDKARMRRNLDLTNGLLLAGDVAAALIPIVGRAQAHALVEEAADETRRTGAVLRDTLLALPSLPDEAHPAIEAASDHGPAVEAAAFRVAPIVAEAKAVRNRLPERRRKR